MANIRSKGTLNKWLDDKGFGFLKPEKGKEEIFVHISTFDRDLPRRPKAGDTIFYYLQTDAKGKTKAVDAIIEGVAPIVKKPISRQKKHYKEHSSKRSWKFLFFCIALFIGAGGTIFNHFESGSVQRIPADPQYSNAASSSKYNCAGKTRCNQMRSCEEATFYLQNCPGTMMDGDGDGIPCETQWCD